jgi:hypothetical protein
MFMMGRSQWWNIVQAERSLLRAFGWSSYPGYAGLKAPYSFVEEEMVLGE